jgi:hypothetical protein
VGDTVKILGECTGKNADGKLTIQRGRRYVGNRPGVPANELFQDFAADGGVAGEKYKVNVFVVRGVVTGVNQYDITLSGSAAPGPSAAPVPSSTLAGATPDFTVKAEDLFNEFKKDQKATQSKYEGKVVEVSGVIKDFSTMQSLDEGPWIQLEAGTDLFGVVCQSADDEPWATLAPGQQVTVRGKWPPHAGITRLADCVVVQKGPRPALAVTAEQLAREYAADPEATNKKYQGKYLEVTGEVTAREEKGSILTITCKGADQVRVCFLFPTGEKQADPEMRAGAKAHALCRYKASSEKGEVQLENARFFYDAP